MPINNDIAKNLSINIPPAGMKARIGEAEAEALKKLADLERSTIGAAVRLAIREACEKRGLWPPK